MPYASAKDKDGTELCPLMTDVPGNVTPRALSEAQIADLYAYIKSKPISDVPNKGTYCP